MFRTALPICAALLFASAITGRAINAQPDWIRGIYTGESPRPVAAAPAEAWDNARRLVERTPRAFVLVGSGRSMQPLYQPGTILVLQQLPFQQLKRGQTVLYRNRQDKVVAHVLVARGRDGWRVQGLNNRIHDGEPVHAGNLVGVVLAAYSPTATASASLVSSTRNLR